MLKSFRFQKYIALFFQKGVEVKVGGETYLETGDQVVPTSRENHGHKLTVLGKDCFLNGQFVEVPKDDAIGGVRHEVISQEVDLQCYLS